MLRSKTPTNLSKPKARTPHPESLNPPQPDACSVSAAGALPSSAVCAVPRGALCYGLGFEAVKVLGCGAPEKRSRSTSDVVFFCMPHHPTQPKTRIPNNAQVQKPQPTSQIPKPKPLNPETLNPPQPEASSVSAAGASPSSAVGIVLWVALRHALNHKPYIPKLALNPKRQILNPKPQTLNPKPQTPKQ